MPFYEYQCKNCGHDLEVMQKINDAPLKKCPHCGKSQLQRLMSAPVFRLKGAGWYETDFKGDQDNKKNLADRPESDASKEPAKGTAKESDAKGGEAKTADGKTDSKDAGKAADKSADKPAAKPVEKASTDPGKKAIAKKPSQRGVSSPNRPGARRAAAKPAAKRKRAR